jgi:hypothetical protein
VDNRFPDLAKAVHLILKTSTTSTDTDNLNAAIPLDALAVGGDVENEQVREGLLQGADVEQQ